MRLSPAQAFMLQTLENGCEWGAIFSGKRGAGGTYWSLVRRGLIDANQLTPEGRKALELFHDKSRWNLQNGVE